MKIVTVLGARPQFIKAAVVSCALKTLPHMTEILVHTGQHYDDNMSDSFFRELKLPAVNYNLSIGSGSHGAQTGRMLALIEEVLQITKPDRVLVYGDTNSTLAGALAAAKLCLPVAHVEAGLRSFNRCMPEEINRVLTDHVSQLLFAPTPNAACNLAKEGIDRPLIFVTGDVMYDLALQSMNQMHHVTEIHNTLGLRSDDYILATVHRAENTDNSERLCAIVGALMDVAADCPVVLPIHPRTRKEMMAQNLLSKAAKVVNIVEPVCYFDMLALEKNAHLIITDSGGVQKEAFFCGVPCLTLREETEWTELLDLDCNRLVAVSNRTDLVAAIRKALDWKPDFTCRLYGDGQASHRIAELLATPPA